MEIFHLINSINPNKASGADSINPFFFGIGAAVLAPILSIYFQWSFDLGIFSQAFKTAKVIPIFKSGSRGILGNYRLIALFSNLSKILEKLIKIRFDNLFLKIKFCTQINMVLETITALITLYLTLSLTVTMPCIAHNTQHCCL